MHSRRQKRQAAFSRSGAALTGDAGLTAGDVGKISVFEFQTYVALKREIAEKALRKLLHSNIKGKRFKMRFIEE